MHKHITYYTQPTVCQRGFYEHISSNNFLSSSPWAYTGFAKGAQLFGGLGELHTAKRGIAKRLLGGYCLYFAASGPLHNSLHIHRALCNNAGLSWSYGKVLRRQLEL